MAIWNIIESHVSVICACIIVIQPALKKIVEAASSPSRRLMTRLRSYGITSAKRAGSDDAKEWPLPAEMEASKGPSAWLDSGSSAPSSSSAESKHPRDMYAIV